VPNLVGLVAVVRVTGCSWREPLASIAYPAVATVPAVLVVYARNGAWATPAGLIEFGALCALSVALYGAACLACARWLGYDIGSTLARIREQL
jgi:hypothetical protein